MSKWPTIKLREVLEVQNGFAFKSSQFNNEEQGFPIIRIRDLATNTVGTWYEGEFDPNYVVHDGDLLVGMDGEFNCVEWTGGPALLNQRVCRLKGFSGVLAKYVFYGISKHLKEIESQTAFVTVKHLSSRQINDIDFSLPPLSEQERIVRLLDEADAIRNLRAKADQRITDLIPALFHQMFGDPMTNPMGWPIVTIGELLASRPNYGTMKPASTHQGEWLTLRVANLQEGSLILTDRKFVDLKESELERHTVSDGDLLLARAIGSISHLGKSVVVNPGDQRWAFDSHLMRIRLNANRCEPLWLKAFLETPGGRQLFLAKTRKSAVQFNINVKEFSSLLVPLPPIGDQVEFVTQVQKVQALTRIQDDNKFRLDRVQDSLLWRAFS